MKTLLGIAAALLLSVSVAGAAELTVPTIKPRPHQAQAQACKSFSDKKQKTEKAAHGSVQYYTLNKAQIEKLGGTDVKFDTAVLVHNDKFGLIVLVQGDCIAFETAILPMKNILKVLGIDSLDS